MKYLNKLKFVLLFSGCSLFPSTQLLAQETQQEINDRSGGFLTVGIGYLNEVSPYHDKDNGFSLSFSGRYQWENGLFIEAPGRSNKLAPGFTYGYNFYNTEHWDFDFIVNNSHGKIDYSTAEPGQSINITRDGSSRAGFRATGYFEQDTVQFIATPYSNNDEYEDGLYSSLWYAKHWQLKNWNYHASLGLQYRSEEILDYYYGVPADLAINNTPAYSTGSGINKSIQIGANYPISKDWMFESYVRHTKLADSISDSPIMYNAVISGENRETDITEVGFYFNYVF